MPEVRLGVNRKLLADGLLSRTSKTANGEASLIDMLLTRSTGRSLSSNAFGSGLPVVLFGYTVPVPSSTIVAVPAVPMPPVFVAVKVNVSAPSYVVSFTSAVRTSSVLCPVGIATLLPGT